jgi:MFS family permease
MSALAPPRGSPTYREALAVRPFRLLLASHGLATTAQLMLTLALGLAVHERTGSALGTSASIALGFAPYVLCSGAAGALADRWSRSTALAGSAALRATLALVLVLALATNAPSRLLVAVVAATAIAATIGYPALAAATVQSVDDRELPAANTLVTGAENSLWIAGPGIVGVLTVLGLGPASVIGVAAVLLVLATLCASAARLPRPVRVKESETSGALAGVLLCVRGKDVRRPMLVAILSNFLYGYLVVHLMLVSGGSLNGAFAAGAFAALPVANRLTGLMPPRPTLAVVMVTFTAAAMVLACLGARPAGVVAIAVAGAASLLSEVIAVTMLQRSAPKEAMARLFGVYDQLNVGAIVLGSMLAGPLSVALGDDAALAVVAAACLVVASAALVPAPSVQRGRGRFELAPWLRAWTSVGCGDGSGDQDQRDGDLDKAGELHRGPRAENGDDRATAEHPERRSAAPGDLLDGEGGTAVRAGGLLGDQRVERGDAERHGESPHR